MSSHKWTGAPEQWTPEPLDRATSNRSNTSRRLGSALLVGVAITGGAALTGGTASAATQDAPQATPDGMKTTQTIDNAKKDTVDPHSTVKFGGTLKSGDRPMPGQQVELQWRTGNGSWHDGGSAKTDKDGHATIDAKTGASAQWRLTYSGDAFHAASHSRTSVVYTQKPVNQRIVNAAADQAGKPYEYGADGPKAFDCSGLTQFAYRAVGVKLPHSSQAQADAARSISRKDMTPGDLLFFGGSGNVHHVAVYAGDGKMWTAPQSGDVVKLQKIYTDDYTVGRAWS